MRNDEAIEDALAAADLYREDIAGGFTADNRATTLALLSIQKTLQALVEIQWRILGAMTDETLR